MARLLLVCNLNCDHLLELAGPLTPGGRVDARSSGRRLGGAGANAGSALALAGHRVSVACAVGDDPRGDWLCAEAQAVGIGTERVERYPGVTPEVLLLRQPDGERSILFVDRRPPYRPSLRLLDERPAALLVNSASDAAAGLMAAALRTDCLVLAQLPQRVIPRWPAQVLIGSESDLDPDIRGRPFAAGREMAGEALRWVVITRGAAGAVAYGADRQVEVPASPALAVVDTTGAGDVFAAGLLDGLLRGLSMADALAAAAAWAAVAVASPTSVAPAGLRSLMCV